MEVEIKAKCPETSFIAIRDRLLKLNAVKKTEKHQLDQYYNLSHVDLRGTKRYIRLRNDGEQAIFAFHENLSSGLTNELEVKVADKETFEKILEKSGFKKLGLIDKTRETYQLDEYEICLDKVKGIGTFVEIETDGNESNWQEKERACIELLKKIGLDEKSLTKEFLADIATRK